MSQALVSDSVGPEVIYLVFQHPWQSGVLARLAGGLLP